jgi:hypothetical protein
MPKLSGKNVFNMWMYFGQLVYVTVNSPICFSTLYPFSEKVCSYPTINTQIFHYFHTVKNSLLPLVFCIFSPVSTTPTINYQKGRF